MRIEVAYATPDRQVVIPVLVAVGATLEQGIKASGILEQFPEIDLATRKVGIFGQVCPPEKTVNAGDRIEIYRPLAQNPMDARRNRSK
ncbi:MAG: RnfH family protein [Methylococcales bacterium]|nr:RnfH family protein [Methylococcales bacterium]